MTHYVIKRGEQYVMPAGSARSYTTKLQNARVFVSRAAAERECCEDEVVVSVAAEMGFQ